MHLLDMKIKLGLHEDSCLRNALQNLSRVCADENVMMSDFFPILNLHLQLAWRLEWHGRW